MHNNWVNFSKGAFFSIGLCEIFSPFKGGPWPKWPNGKYAYATSIPDGLGQCPATPRLIVLGTLL